MRIGQPHHRAVVRAHVVRVAPLSTHFATVPPGGPDLAGEGDRRKIVVPHGTNVH